MVDMCKWTQVEFPFDVGFYKNICSVLGDNPLLWAWPAPPKGNGLKYAVKPNTGTIDTCCWRGHILTYWLDPLIPYSWPPRDPKDLGPSLIERIEQEQTIEGPRLVRRDSEGYLVREITMEDRMRMLNGEINEDMAFDSNRDPLEQEAHEQFVSQQHQEIDPDDYYYDSASVSDGFTEDEEQLEEEEGQGKLDEWVDEE